MNGLPDWDQMSVREQCEVLKAKIDGLVTMDSFLAASGQGSSWTSSLIRRVSALEAAQGRTHFEGDDCPGGHYPLSGVDLHEAKFFSVPERDVERWRRIEEAARAFIDKWRSEEVCTREANALAKALDS